MKLKNVAAATALALAAFGATNASAIPLELALVIDVSGSVSASEYTLQRDGYVSAFQNNTVINNILSFASSGGIAVSVFQFSTSAVQSIGWTILDSTTDIANFATAISTMSRATSGSIGVRTDIIDGINLAASSMLTNQISGDRMIIDVSGDGRQNEQGCTESNVTCTPLQTARNSAAARGITINGIAILNDDANLGTYYTNNLKTTDGFVLTASFGNFGSAITEKIGREIIQQVPEPGALALLGIGLMGLATARRRKQAA